MTASALALAFNRDTIRPVIADLASRGIFVGTSSWKYPGWRGMLYDESRYVYRGKFAMSRFEKNCLTEYAEVFKTVCVDAAYYTFPSEKYLQGLVSQVPVDFKFAFKVTDAVTIKKFPNLPRFGAKAGSPNETFLNADLFERQFLLPCETIRPHVGVLMFEFSRFHKPDYEHGRDFIADLDKFLGHSPKAGLTQLRCGTRTGSNRNTSIASLVKVSPMFSIHGTRCPRLMSRCLCLAVERTPALPLPVFC